MVTYMMLKVDFQKLSEIEIFRKSKDFGLISTSMIIMCSWCCIWCWKQHSITVAGFQQKCCFSATNVDFSCKYYFIQAKIEKLTKNNCGNKSATNVCLPTAPQFNFHLWCRVFSCFDKINHFWQQKQQVLFLNTMTPKVLLT